MVYTFSAGTSNEDILNEYIAQYHGMSYSNGSPIQGIDPDYIIDTDSMAPDVILKWIDDQNEYDEFVCKIMADMCNYYDLKYDEQESADDVFERLCTHIKTLKQ